MNTNQHLLAPMVNCDSVRSHRFRPAYRVVALLLWMISSAALGQEKLSPEQLQFFEAKIRPVLVDKCYSCHSAKAGDVQGGLLLDTREGIRRGGDSGAAVVPGNLQASLLISAIRYANDDLKMPPKDDGGKLPDSVIGDFETWVRMGAPDPRDGASKVVTRYDTSQARKWWSFQRLKSVTAPSTTIATQFAKWPQSDIDRFVAAQWELTKLSPVADAEPLVLLRRLRFDLTGLPPSDQECEDFLKRWSSSGDRESLLKDVVDRLLDSREYAERWGRHWLDVARYAESSGKDANLVYPHAWRYRDYVIDSFDKDKPFDQFAREQIAGDLLPAKMDSQRAEQLIATAFLAIGEIPINERNPKQFAVDLADDQIAAVAQAFLGQTVACARCHDHRFDPISQRDYTALAGIFLSTETKYGTPGAVGGRNRAGLVDLPAQAGLPVVASGLNAAEIQQKQQKLERLQQQQRSARAQRANGGKPTDGLSDFDVVRISTQVSQLEFELSFVNENGSAKALAMGVSDRPNSAPQARRPGPGRPMPGGRPSGAGPARPMPPDGPRQPGGPKQQPGEPMAGGLAGRRMQSSGFEAIADSPLFLRGSIENVGLAVPRGVPGLLGTGTDLLIRQGSGRLELANALVSAENTLTSRVIVNRVWHWLFGRGLVESVDNFGTTGAQPTHPELLNYLADRFVRNGWSIKQLIREITLSRVYRLSSNYDETCFAADPDNTMLWRHNSRRLEAEEIRDGIMTASGRLNRQPQPGSLIGRAGDGPIGGERFQAVTLQQIEGANNNFRSIYLPATRSLKPAVLFAFDPPDTSATDGARDATNVPSQALFMLNSDFVAEQSQALADIVLKAYPGATPLASFKERLRFVFRRILNRDPSETESMAAETLVKATGNSRAAWTSVVRGLFGSAEFRFVD
jgi:hypothetical protein